MNFVSSSIIVDGFKKVTVYTFIHWDDSDKVQKNTSRFNSDGLTL